MARRQFQVIDVVEVLQHWHAGRPKTVVAASLGVDVKTVRKYVAAAEAVGIVPGDGHAVDRAGWAARVAGWFPELVDARARSRSWPTLNDQRALIESMLATNTLATVHQRLRDEHGLMVSQSSLRRYVALELPERAAQLLDELSRQVGNYLTLDKTWTRIDRDHQTLRTDMNTLLQDLGIATNTPAAA